jgi:hypothetical protein
MAVSGAALIKKYQGAIFSAQHGCRAAHSAKESE